MSYIWEVLEANPAHKLVDALEHPDRQIKLDQFVHISGNIYIEVDQRAR